MMAGSNIWHRGAMALILGLLLLLFVDNTVARTRDQTPLTMAQNTKKNVAIIGAGAGGSSAAWHLSKYSKEANIDVTITMFEKSSYIGGRSTTVDIWDNYLYPVELGASIFVEVNTILVGAMNEFGLKTVRRMDHDQNELMGIWDGTKFVLVVKETESSWWTAVKMTWKYGLSPYRTQKLMKSTVGNFKKLYEAPFFPFRSLTSRVQDLGPSQITAMTGAEYLAANKISKAFSRDVIQASTRVNYASNLGIIHGLETMVCMAIDGQIQVHAGNWRIFQGMVNASSATLNLETVVDRLSKKDGKWIVDYKSIGVDESSAKEFDTVVIATPIQYSGLKIEEGLVNHIPDDIPYVELHVTLFTTSHNISRSYFGIKEGKPMPDTILTTTPEDFDIGDRDEIVGPSKIFSLSSLRKVVNPVSKKEEVLYKIFSPKPMTAALLGALFNMSLPEDLKTAPTDKLSWVYTKVWNSYPYEYPRVTFEETILANGLYYTSGMESFISTMETMALMGKNVARLIVDEFEGLKQGTSAVVDGNGSGGTGQSEL